MTGINTKIVNFNIWPQDKQILELTAERQFTENQWQNFSQSFTHQIK